MAIATCPECDAEVEVDEVVAEIGDEVSCPECGQNLVVGGTEPIELDSEDEDDDDDDEDDEDDDEDDDAEADDEDEEREDGDVEE
jgi:DNA-directed RNA polymerase subunit RPC12/RpoP